MGARIGDEQEMDSRGGEEEKVDDLKSLEQEMDRRGEQRGEGRRDV